MAGTKTSPGLARQEPAEVAAMFGRIAPRYDLLNHLLCGGSDWYWRQRLAGSVRAHRPARVLDLATGSGDVLLTLQRRGAFTGSAVGLDSCLPMLRRAQFKGAPRLLAGDALRLPFRDGSFDAVTIAFGLRNFADRAAGLREMRRVLRPGGRVHIAEFSQPVAGFAPLYFAYLRHVMPLYARLFTRESGAYLYLAESIQAFPRPAALAEMMREAGFRHARWKRLTLGIVALHTGEVESRK